MKRDDCSAVRFAIACPGCKRVFTSMNSLRRHRNHITVQNQCCGLEFGFGMLRPVRAGARTGEQDLSDSEMDTDVIERMRGIRNTGLLAEGPENGVPPGSDGPVCRVCTSFVHSLYIVLT